MPSFLSENRTRGERKIPLLLILPNRFYHVGYEDGYKHGRLHGLIEGRALGAEKGFELWEELGFYEGAARFWTTIAATDASGTDACVLVLTLSEIPYTRKPTADPLFCLFLFPFFFLTNTPSVDAVRTTRLHYSA